MYNIQHAVIENSNYVKSIGKKLYKVGW